MPLAVILASVLYFHCCAWFSDTKCDAWVVFSLVFFFLIAELASAVETVLVPGATSASMLQFVKQNLHKCTLATSRGVAGTHEVLGKLTHLLGMRHNKQQPHESSEARFVDALGSNKAQSQSCVR